VHQPVVFTVPTGSVQSLTRVQRHATSDAEFFENTISIAARMMEWTI